MCHIPFKKKNSDVVVDDAGAVIRSYEFCDSYVHGIINKGALKDIEGDDSRL